MKKLRKKKSRYFFKSLDLFQNHDRKRDFFNYEMYVLWVYAILMLMYLLIQSVNNNPSFIRDGILYPNSTFKIYKAKLIFISH